MMKNDLFITKRGILSKKENTLYFYNAEEKMTIPIKTLRQIFISTDVSLRSGAIKLLIKYSIPIHFINKYGEYEASIINKSFDTKGNTLVKQVESYLNEEKRLKLAKEMIKGIVHNINKILSYYRNRSKNVETKFIELENVNTISKLRAREAEAWKHFYSQIPNIINESEFEFSGRKFRPPADEINAMISYLNSVFYSNVLTMIYKSELHPSISYVHEPSDRTFSLALDISDIFKPIFIYRTIFKLINKKIINLNHFDRKTEGVYLNEVGRYILLEEYEKALNETIYNRILKRKISYYSIVENEISKLYLDIIGKKEYKSFKIWW